MSFRIGDSARTQLKLTRSLATGVVLVTATIIATLLSAVIITTFVELLR